MGYHETFRALSDGTRREILMLLRNGSMTAGDIAARFSMTNATVSHHLAVLKESNLVVDKRRGKYIYYELNSSVIEEIMMWLLSLKGDAKSEGQ
ncbi:MAG: autorepressor SdpR family transcription factor [Clostridiales bacterium]|jgi:DNA-binding transcriptional ArsR family regulator|nr:autorepressor SdpR family transcription factor [Eubacteriales bacterium]MDH7567532.1 autorepressor SdpR family transcription factor [Clostridiales bacterium]